MKGLLIKDWKLIKNQRKFLILAAVYILIVTVMNEDGYTFAGAYLTFFVTLLALSTFSYDEQNGGMGYLIALPVSRKTYVREKYLFGILLALGSWILTSLLAAAAMMIRNPGQNPFFILVSAASLPVYLLLLIITIPLKLKFGAEKGQLAMVGVIGAAVLGVLGISRAASGEQEVILQELGVLLEQHTGFFIAVAVILYAAVAIISYLSAVRIMEKKEF